MTQKIETAFAPDLYKFHNKCQTVVLIDVARFTSTMVTALANGALCVETYPDTETPLRLKREKGYLIAGEEHGKNIEGYDFNNSPVAMTREAVSGRRMAFCTSNGTYARSIAGNCESLIAASFLNAKAVISRLSAENKSIMFLCSGRSRKPAIEDILLAGKIAGELMETGNFETKDESTNMAIQLYNLAKNDVKAFTFAMYPTMAEFCQRFPHFGRDIEFLFGHHDIYNIVPEETSPSSFTIAANGKKI